MTSLINLLLKKEHTGKHFKKKHGKAVMTTILVLEYVTKVMYKRG